MLPFIFEFAKFRGSKVNFRRRIVVRLILSWPICKPLQFELTLIIVPNLGR